jgi:hypothetical protein
MSDNKGNTYVTVKQVSNGTAWQSMGYATITTGGTVTITGSISASCTFYGICVLEYSGIDTTTPFVSGEYAQQYDSAPGAGTDAITTGNTPALSGSPCAVIGMGNNVDNNAPSGGTGFTARSNVWTDVGQPEDKRVTSTAAVSATWTAQSGQGGNHYLTQVLVLHEASSGGAGGVGSYQFVQQSENSNTSSAQTSISTGPITVTQGNTLVWVVLGGTSTLVNVTITDTLGLTWNVVRSQMQPSNTRQLAIGYAYVSVGGSTTITATIT